MNLQTKNDFINAMPTIAKENIAARGASECHVLFSTGDALWLADQPSMDSAAATEALVDLYVKFGVTRVYWRGLQQSLWNKALVRVPEAVVYTGMSPSVDEQYARFAEKHGMTMDAYFVQKAHEKGIEVWGLSTLQDWGSAADVPINYWPTHHNAKFRIEHPEWVPKDKHGFIEQGGAIDFAYPEARKTLVDLHREQVEIDDYDGIMFLTYSENFSIVYNDQFGFSEPTVTEFKKRYGITPGKDPFTRTASIFDWRRLRGEYTTQFLREMKAALGDKGLGLVLDPRDPYYTQIWQYQSLNKNALYLDLPTYIKEGSIDQFLINGFSTVNIQRSTAEDMLFLARGTKTKVALLTSNPFADSWTELRAANTPTVFSTGGFGEELFFSRHKTVDGSEDTAVKTWLSKIAMHEITADVSEIAPYLNANQPFMTLRLAIKALAAIAPVGGDELLAPLLGHSEPGIRGLVAMAYKRMLTPGSATRLLAALDVHTEWSLREAISVTLRANAGKCADELIEVYKTSENPLIRATVMKGLSSIALPQHLALLLNAVETEFAPEGSTELEHNYYRSIRYFATQAIGCIDSEAAVDALMRITTYDTTECNRAVISLGEMAQRGCKSIEARRAEVVKALDAVLEKTGEGSVRTDSTWAYRPIGEALLRLGDAGRAVLERNLYRTDDLKLALNAWKSLYIPYKVCGYIEMTEQEYDAAYDKMPEILRNF